MPGPAAPGYYHPCVATATHACLQTDIVWRDANAPKQFFALMVVGVLVLMQWAWARQATEE